METVEADYMQTGVDDVVDEEEAAITMAIRNTTKEKREEKGAMAIGDALIEETSATFMPNSDSAEMPISGATVAQILFDGATMMPSSGATQILIDGEMELLSNSATATPTIADIDIPAGGATAMPVDGEMEFPRSNVTATPAIAATASPAGAMPVDGEMELKSNSTTATPTFAATTMPAGGASAMPVDEEMEFPSNIATATPTTGATAMMFSIGMDCEPSTPDVDLCKVCGQRHLLDENHEYNYKEEVDDELTCHICLQPLISPLDTPCGHTYCQECLTNFLVESDFCPVDRVPILLQNCRKSNVLVHKLLDKLTVSCPFSEHCSETMSRGDLQGHILRR
ncbi:E3 ubiquitin-protein ligase LNX isoform X1 [Tachysurus ichikawai]